MDLPGVELSMLDLLTKEDQVDYLEFWEMIYDKAWQGFVSDLTHQLQEKFFVDSKLVSRETSQFVSSLSNTGLSGVTIEFELPRYAKMHVVSIDLWSVDAHLSPGIEIKIFDQDASGEELYSEFHEVEEGLNTIFIDRDFNTNKILVVYDADSFVLKQTELRRYFNTTYIDYSCDTCAFDCGGYTGRVTEYNGGGLNVKYNVFCSVEKFACENINLFKQAIFYRVGLELLYERMFGNRINKYMTMTIERKDELQLYFNTEYEKNLSRSVRNQSMGEDPYCFSCKGIVMARAELP